MAKRIFGKQERYRPIRKGRHRKVRPKTFKTEAAAKRWAESKGIKSYDLKNTKNLESKTKKIFVIQK